MENLSVAQRADLVELSFAAPYQTLDGEALSVLDVEVFFASVDGAMDAVGEIRKLDAVPGEAVATTWPLPEPDALLRFSVRTLSRGKASPLSAELRFIAREPPAVPHDVAGTVIPDGVRLFWTECVASLADPWVPPLPLSPAMQMLLDDLNALVRGELSPEPGDVDTAGVPEAESGAQRAPGQPKSANALESSLATPSPGPSPGPDRATSPGPDRATRPGPGRVTSPATSPVPGPAPEVRPTAPSLGVALYRRIRDGDFEPLGTQPLVTQAYTDTDVVPGERYCYVLRTVLSGTPQIESRDSAEACVTFRDVSIPKAPVGLSLLRREDGTVGLSWSPSPETDLSHYNVYRASVGEQPQSIAQVPAGQTQYIDQAVPPGIVIYTLSAEDAAGNESPPTSAARLRPE